MEFIVGTLVFLSSILVLGVLARIAAVNPDARILHGDIIPSVLAVFVSCGLGIGLVMMVLGGGSYFPSRAAELAVIAAFAVLSVWIMLKLVGRARQDRPVSPDWGPSQISGQ